VLADACGWFLLLLLLNKPEQIIYTALVMQRPQRTINRAITREGASLSSHKWIRVPMAVLLILGGAILLYMGVTGEERMLVVVGSIFILCSAATCYMIRKAEKTISKLQGSIDEIVKAVDEKEEEASSGS
jgi:hypothetical protein